MPCLGKRQQKQPAFGKRSKGAAFGGFGSEQKANSSVKRLGARATRSLYTSSGSPNSGPGGSCLQTCALREAHSWKSLPRQRIGTSVTGRETSAPSRFV